MPELKLFIDSGAYSAWALANRPKNGVSRKFAIVKDGDVVPPGTVTINIDEYIRFIKQHEEWIDIYVSLDVIGNGKASYDNWIYMKSQGVDPVPVFHAGTDLKYLELYLKEVDYLALGGLVSGGINDTIQALDYIWTNYLTDESGMPKLKVHGFGITTIKSILRYPWYSADSSTWCIIARNGVIIVPRFRNGKWIYDETSWKVPVSSRSPGRKERGAHFDTLPEAQRSAILTYLHSLGYVMGRSHFKEVDKAYKPVDNERWAGPPVGGKRRLEIIDEPGVSTEYVLRDEVNVLYFVRLQQEVPEWPWPFRVRHSVPLI